MAKIEVKKSASVFDIVEQMQRWLPDAILQGKIIAPYFCVVGESASDVVARVWTWLRDSVEYVADGEKQVLQMPGKFARTLRGDCKSYTMFAAAVLLNCGFRVRFVFTENSGKNEPEHVYLEVMNEMGNIVPLDGTISKPKAPPQRTRWETEWLNGCSRY